MAPASFAPKTAFVVHLKLTVDPKDVATLLGHCRETYERVTAEPECAFFLMDQSVLEPGVVNITEGWTKDHQWFTTEQVTKPYYKPFQAAIEPLFIKPRVAEVSIAQEGFNYIKVDV